MRIADHLLCVESAAIEHALTSNMGGIIVPEYLVIHFTDGLSAASSVQRFRDPGSGVSAHVVIDRGGKLWQVVPFNRAAWHAGVSSWAGRQALNQFSIGIELENAGRLQPEGTRFRARFGDMYDVAEVVRARHKFEATETFWHAYSDIQLAKLLELSRLLITTYGLKDAVGHDDIAPTRKVDPGPAFPMRRFRNALFGREGECADATRPA